MTKQPIVRPTINLNAFGCLALLIVILGVPCLAIWYFGALSLILSGLVVVFGHATFFFIPPFPRRNQSIWNYCGPSIILGLVTAFLIGLVVFINYFL
jgi:hypothetical protein